MTAEQLVEGLRERGFWVMRMMEPPTVILPKIWPADPLVPFLRDELGCTLVEYEAEQFTHPGRRQAYEVRLSSARVEVDESDLSEDPNERALQLQSRRARAIWEAASPPTPPWDMPPPKDED